MPITTDIVESYRRPRAVLRRRMGGAENEGRALALLMGACLLIFISQWPGLRGPRISTPRCRSMPAWGAR